ncbi:MAG: hypothetical protein PVH64_11960 [Bacillota bacterium]|jgi:hypothetical protein
MLKLLKWDFLNFIKRCSWLYISFAIVLAIVAVFPDHIYPFSVIVDQIGAVYSLFFYGYTMLISFAVAINWLRRNSAQLELSLPVRPGKILLSKLILSVCINISGLFLSQLLWSLIKRFGMSRIVLFNDFEGFWQYIIGTLVLLVIFMFSYITAKSFNFTRNKSRSATVLISLAIGALLVGLVILLFTASGAWNITVKNYGYISISPNEKLRMLVTTCNIGGAVGIIIAGLWGSSTLLRHKFER